jgi:hypothetical protein
MAPMPANLSDQRVSPLRARMIRDITRCAYSSDG